MSVDTFTRGGFGRVRGRFGSAGGSTDIDGFPGRGSTALRDDAPGETDLTTFSRRSPDELSPSRGCRVLAVPGRRFCPVRLDVFLSTTGTEPLASVADQGRPTEVADQGVPIRADQG